jgi:TonB-linked SusC/RagA family outer membrane protein
MINKQNVKFMRKLTFLLACLFLIGLGLVNAQSKSISGKVISTEDGQPVIGASVMVKGTQTGTITGIDGSFTIAITGNSKTLTISYVGMKTIEVDVSKSQKLTVSLSPDVFGLNEVVVSGVAAETSKKKLAVSVTKVGEDDLEKVTASSAASALQGKVAGVTVTNSTGQPGDGATIIIRGATQIAGSQDPLIIVDGVLLKGTLADVNVDDIESMEVVKGASASALYGSQAGNGVIVVTTKRGKGLNVGQTSVTFRNEYGINRLSKEYNLATHHAYTLASDWENYSTYTKYDGVTYPSGYAGGYSDEISGSRSLDADHYMDNPYARTYDLQKEFFKGNNFYTNYISVQNKGEKSNTLASFENYKQNGIIFDDQGYSRHSFRINTDQRIKDNITLSASNLYVISSQKYPGDNGANKYNGGSFFNLLLTAPDVDLNMKNVDGQPYQFIPDPWEPTTENPLYSVYKIDNLLKRNRFLGSYNLSWNITPALKFTGDYAFEKSSEMYTEYKPYDTYERGSSGAQYSQGLYYKYASDDFSEKAQASFSYAKSIQDFNLRAKASYLYENRVFESFSATGYDFGVKDIPSFDAIGGTKTATSYQSQIVAENAFAILYADYKEKYIFDGMFRYDGSSLFGSEQRWQPYYRVSGAWRVTEDFKISGINEFKIRAALGTAGQRPPFSAQYEVMSVSNGVTSKYYKGNKDLKPSRTTEFEAGFDIDFLDKFSFSAVYSKANTADQFLNAPLASYANGWLYQWINAGTLASNTFEATLAAKIINSKDFKWSAGLTFDRSRNQITKLNIPAYQTGPEGQDANKLFYIKEGETLGTMYGYKFIRTMEQLNQQISFMDGTIDDYEVNSDGYVIKKGTAGTVDEKPIKLLDQDGNAAFVKIGDSNPDFKMGITTNLSYKDWSLYALFDWKQGGDVYNKTAQWLTRDSRNGIMDQYGKADSEKKTIDYYQAFYDTNDFNDYWVEDGSYLKLRELSISYSVNKKTLSKFASGFIQGVSLSVIGRNLFTLTKYSGYDPEVATSDTDGTQTYAYDFMGYPNFRSFSVSLELKF